MGRRRIVQAVAVLVCAASVLAQGVTLLAQKADTARDLPGVLVSRHVLETQALERGRSASSGSTSRPPIRFASRASGWKPGYTCPP